MPEQPERPRRPVLRPSLAEALSSSEADPAARHELAHSTASAVLAAGRSGAADPCSLVSLAERVGLDELAELWRHAEPGTLPATLWALYLVRAWCHRRGEEVARLYRAGKVHAEVAEVIAGVPYSPEATDMARLADALLEDLFRGDLSTSLHRAAAFTRIIAAGRAHQALGGPAPAGRGAGGGDGTSEAELGARALEVAAQLERAAAAWDAGTLH